MGNTLTVRHSRRPELTGSPQGEDSTLEVPMFKSLRTSTKLFLLCSVFVGALLVATYALVAEKQIAIQFVRKELVGVQKLEELRRAYASILIEELGSARGGGPKAAVNETPAALAAADAPTSVALDTVELERALAAASDKLSSAPDGDQRQTLLVAALAAARRLASRIGDDSNLTLDPDLDSYYVQDILVSKLPSLLSQIGELQSQLQNQSPGVSLPDAAAVHALVLDGTIRSTLEAVESDLAGSYRGGDGSHLRAAIQADFDAMASASRSYLETVQARLAGASSSAARERSYLQAVNSTMKAWTASQEELSRLLNIRLSKLLGKLRGSLLLNGLLAAFSLAFALLTGRHIVQPLLKLERLADKVGETKDYRLRTDYESGDEIGRLAVAFNAMLAELAAARDREVADAGRAASVQAELARVARVTTMGEMAASIAHEINQPLAAIVNNASASLRWLGHRPPNVERASSALKQVVDDGERASEVIRSIRGLLQKSSEDKVFLDVNELVREVTTFARADLRHHGITLRTELADELPRVPAVRVQLQQVLLNLIANALDAMTVTSDRPRVLSIRSQKADGYGILLTVEDTGPGIDPGKAERIFEPFYSTKPEGMGMGLSICRSIVEAYGGRVSASVGDANGTIIKVLLPDDETN
jgi:signal transduction histidine kinase